MKNILLLLQEIYTNNEVYVKVSEGPCQPFRTTVGVLQGEANSPSLFNLFVNKISDIFDQSCDPVSINNTDQSCLLWADDLFVVSQSAEGLQKSIDRVYEFYTSLGLQLNVRKTKIMIFNRSGRVSSGYSFMMNKTPLDQTDSYR